MKSGTDDTPGSLARQGAWMIFATSLASFLMLAMHVVAPWMSRAEYGLLGTLLQVLAIMMIPSMGLQAIFAHHAAAAVDPMRQEALAAAALRFLLATGLLWLVFVLLAGLFRDAVVIRLKMSSPAALWLTVMLGLPQLWLPILMGLLQGRQNFKWLGWSQILNGAGRFLSVVAIVVFLGGQAAGAMAGVLLGLTVALIAAAWHCRDIWSVRPRGGDWHTWLKPVVPITLGLGTCQVMLSADMIFARSAFAAEQSGPYAAAGTVARGLVLLTGPLVAVMYPVLVRSAARSERTRVVGRTLLATAACAVSAAVVCTLAARMIPYLMDLAAEPGSALNRMLRTDLAGYRDAVLAASDLLPWFVWAMVPLSLAIVLVAALVGRGFYRSVACLTPIPVAYLVSLSVAARTMTAVIGLLGLFNVVLLATVSMMTLRASRRALQAQIGGNSVGGPIARGEPDRCETDVRT